ncbi:MAG: hypothetical protein JW891_01400, partial [Candidatus Lokiarchaeota archaeon]|nr:hypothetical protein [Candidatus Lokiarchaeota archaeon]
NTGKEIMEKVYTTTYLHKDLKSALQLYNRLFNLWFKGCKHKTEYLSDNEANVIYEDFDADFEYFFHTARGWIEASIIQLLGKKGITKFIAESWKGDKTTIINVILPKY